MVAEFHSATSLPTPRAGAATRTRSILAWHRLCVKKKKDATAAFLQKPRACFDLTHCGCACALAGARVCSGEGCRRTGHRPPFALLRARRVGISAAGVLGTASARLFAAGAACLCLCRSLAAGRRPIHSVQGGGRAPWEQADGSATPLWVRVQAPSASALFCPCRRERGGQDADALDKRVGGVYLIESAEGSSRGPGTRARRNRGRAQAQVMRVN